MGYVTIDEATTYFDDDINFYDIWNDFSETEKQRYINFCSKYLDKMTTWLGRKTHAGQTYEFPRNFENIWQLTDLRDPYYANHNRIPDEIKTAVYYLITELYTKKQYKNIKDLIDTGVTSFDDGLMSFSGEKGEKSLSIPEDSMLEVFKFSSMAKLRTG